MLNQEMDVRSRGITVDAYGGQSVTNTTIYTARMCRINTLSQEQQAILSRSGIVANHKFFCEGDMTIVAENEIVAAGQVYRVVNVVNVTGISSSNHHLEVFAKTPS